MAEKKEKKDVTCFCTWCNTLKQKVIQLIEDGATDIAKISSATECGNRAVPAQCMLSIMELLDEYKNAVIAFCVCL
ncbi:MAG: hypothetical protein Q9N32_07545 [Gammaproteobacteria bacterium]|nr:hypothetical protein [Gammaproteobacteria bacterium]